MANVGNPVSESSRARGTLRIKRLLTTQLKLVRLEVIGQDHPFLVRAGALLVCGPILLVGYAFALAAAVRLLAIRIGWSAGLLLVGVAHLLVGAWGLRRARALSFAESYDVLAPECEPEGPATGRFDFENAATLPRVYAARKAHGPALH